MFAYTLIAPGCAVGYLANDSVLGDTINKKDNQGCTVASLRSWLVLKLREIRELAQ